MSDTPRVDEFCKTSGGQYTYDLLGLARHLERELAAAIEQRNKAVAALKTIEGHHNENDLITGVTERGLKECGK